MSQIFQIKVSVEQVFYLDVEAPDGMDADYLSRIFSDCVAAIKQNPATIIAEADAINVEFLCFASEYDDTDGGTGCPVWYREVLE